MNSCKGEDAPLVRPLFDYWLAGRFVSKSVPNLNLVSNDDDLQLFAFLVGAPISDHASESIVRNTINQKKGQILIY